MKNLEAVHCLWELGGSEEITVDKKKCRFQMKKVITICSTFHLFHHKSAQQLETLQIVDSCDGSLVHCIIGVPTYFHD